MKGRHAALLVVGLACTKADPPEVPQPSGSNGAAPDAAKGPQVKSYLQAAAVDSIALNQAAAIDDFAGRMLAFAPDGKTWATGWASGARLFHGDQELAAAAQFGPDAATAIGFSADSAALHVGTYLLDAASGKAQPQPAIPDLAAWAAAAGQPAPATLSPGASLTSDDGALLVLAATGVTRDRRAGLQKPTSGDVDWVIALDGATRKPTAVLWHGKGVHSAFAISARHVAAGGQAPAKVFDRQALTKAIELGGSPSGIQALAWSPDGELLVAVGGKTIAAWRNGTWDKPAATWESGGQHHAGLAFHPTRPLLAVTNRDGHVRLYGVNEATLSSPPLLLDHSALDRLEGTTFSPDGATLLVIGSAGTNQVLRFDVTLTP